MKCDEVKALFSQIAGKSVSLQVPQPDLDFLSANGYVSVMSKDDYDHALAEVANLSQLSQDAQNESAQVRSAETTLEDDMKKTHSILFHLRGKETKEAEKAKAESEAESLTKEEADLAQRDAAVAQLIQKKSSLDRMVQYGSDGRYISLTGLGVVTLNDLNVRNYRVSDTEFADYAAEIKETWGELKSIADAASLHVAKLKVEFPKAELSELWSVSIGLAKIQGDQDQIHERFLSAMGILNHNFDSTLENKMMGAEILTSTSLDKNHTAGNNSDLEMLKNDLKNIDKQIRHDTKVPKELSAGVATTIMSGRRFDGTYPTDRFVEFAKLTPSFESAAILSVIDIPTDQLTNKFQSFRSLFSSWGYEMSEDTELSSAYLSISDLGPNDVYWKMTILLNALRNHLEYPLVAAAILASIPTLEANETLDLMEKAFTLLSSYAPSLERSELVSLSVRMIHGIRNELVKELDPTAKIANTPVQFTPSPGIIFFPYRVPLIVANASYFSTFSGMGGAHPAHVHAVGGFMG